MLKILVLCTGNSCRSILAEALFNHYGAGRIIAKSAGSFPAGYVHPKSLETLGKNNVANQGFHSKSWNDLEGEDFDLLVTVCDNANGETCPIFLGKTMKTHWGVEDPAHFQGSESEINAKFQEVFEQLKNQVLLLLNTNFEQLSQEDFKDLVDEIGTVN